MVSLHAPRRRALRLLVGTLVSVGAVGCVSGSLASSTGPRLPGQLWSDAPLQFVHCGETVRFDFVLQDGAQRFVSPYGLADYVVVMIGPQRMEAEPDAYGHFQFEHRFNRLVPGQTTRVDATAYQQRGARDFMKINDRWFETDSPFETPDRALAEDRLELVAYQASVSLSLAPPADDLDPDTGVLRIRRVDGTIIPVYIDRPHRRGFKITESDPRGHYLITYQPTGDQLNPVDTTEVEFTIYDVAGSVHRVTATIETP